MLPCRNLLHRLLCTASPSSSSTPWLLVGLGNPGDKFHSTRHNVGFDMIDAFARSQGIPMNTVHFNSLFCEGMVGGTPVLLAKPQTYMNLSGESVGPLAEYYKLPPNRILLIFDDMNLPCGVLRIQPKGGHGKHKGLKSVIYTFQGNRELGRLRIGIGRPPGQMDPKAFLLQKFSTADGCVVENKVLCNSLLSYLQNTDLDNTIYTARLISMVFESQNPSGKTLINQADSRRTSSAVPPFDNIGEEKLHGRSTKLELSDGRTLYAKLVVGADGAKSRVREIAGLKTTGWNYSQSAIICTVEHNVENHCAWQRFLPSGPIALLPVGNKFSNIVWTMSPEGSSIHKSMSADEFIKAVNHALDYGYGSHPQPSFLDRFVDGLTFTRQGAPSTTEGFQVPPKVIKVATERLAFPLSLMHARDYVSKRVALIGDAAHNVHPLAGQGVNLGFGDASALSKVISEGLLVGTDIGELSVLKRYEKERKAANVTMMAILDGFQKAYSVDFGPINLLRAAALHGAQYIPPLKRNIISFAMGDQKFPLFS